MKAMAGKVPGPEPDFRRAVALDACPVPIVSARSGETIVDLAVGWQSPLLKVGSITRGERTAKWNRGLRICRRRAMALAPFPRY